MPSLIHDVVFFPLSSFWVKATTNIVLLNDGVNAFALCTL